MSLRFVRTERRKSSRPLIAAALFCALMLAGCGGSKSKSTLTTAPGTTQTVAASASPTATPPPAVFGQIVWAKSIDPATFAPIDKAASFSTDDAVIYAVIPIQGVTPGLTLTADWTYNDAALNGVRATAVASQPIENGWIEFHLTLAAGQTWPAGTYAVSIHQQAGETVTAHVTVKRAGE